MLYKCQFVSSNCLVTSILVIPCIQSRWLCKTLNHWQLSFHNSSSRQRLIVWIILVPYPLLVLRWVAIGFFHTEPPSAEVVSVLVAVIVIFESDNCALGCRAVPHGWWWENHALSESETECLLRFQVNNFALIIEWEAPDADLSLVPVSNIDGLLRRSPEWCLRWWDKDEDCS